MKFTTKKSELLRAVSVVGRLATTRATLPILQNIYVETDGNLLKLRATDLEQTIETDVEGRVEEPGIITVPARLLTDYLQNNTDEQVTLTTDDLTVHITSRNHSARIKGMAHEEYPTLPAVKADSETVLPAEAFSSAVTRTLFTAANDDTRPILTGLLFKFEGANLTIVGTDGYRLAYSKISAGSPVTGNFILPKRSLQEVLRLLDGEEVKLTFSPSQARFVIGSTRFITRVLEGSFPAYEAIIPKQKKLEIKLASGALLQSLKLASLFSRDSAYSTKIEIAKDKLKITAISPQLGENTNEVALEKEVAGSFQINANAQYLIDVLNVLSGDVLLSFVDQESPIIVSLPKDESYLYLVMPLRTQ